MADLGPEIADPDAITCDPQGVDRTIVDHRFLRETRLLDLGSPILQSLVKSQCWPSLPERDRIGAIYTYVRDQIPFGYNISDDLPASRVLADGYGQCNTKTILLMALLRASGIACRFRAATIHKRLQKGVVNGIFYALTPRDIVHSWAEVRFNGKWSVLEGVILDRPYLQGLRAGLPAATVGLVGFGVGIDDIANPPIEWNGGDTFIQIKGVNRDFGAFADPDTFYEEHGPTLAGLRRVLFACVVRHIMNRNVARIRRRCMLRPPGGGFDVAPR